MSMDNTDNTDDTNKPVDDAEIVETEVTTPGDVEEVMDEVVMNETENEEMANEDVAPGEHSEALSMMNLEDIIRRNILESERLQVELKKQNDMYSDIYEVDGDYAQKADQLETMKKELRGIKDKLLQQSSAIDLAQKITATKEEMKDLKEALSDYLQEFQKTAKTDQIEIDKDDIRQIINITKLIKKSGKYNP